MTKTATERAEIQRWAGKVQKLELKIEQAKDICESYLDGLITAEECATKLAELLSLP